jgi:2-amino-4-hydroxy-6-hydroxymethyldihydropteridine diphosphokinase
VDPNAPRDLLAVALGANLGRPLRTLVGVRPALEALLRHWCPADRPLLRWSPIFRTAPEGGPARQPDYCNAVVVLSAADPGRPVAAAAAGRLLAGLLELETAWGRRRRERWGPRRLDLDLLWCGALRCDGPALTLPHPRLMQRAFVLAPLAAIDPALLLPGGVAAAAALASLPPQTRPPRRLAGRPGWPD